MSLPDARTVFALPQDVSFQTTGEGAVILRLQDGQLYTCDAVSEAFLSRIDGRASLEEIAGAICDEFEVEAQTALADLRELARDFLSEGLLEAREAGRG